MSFGDHFIAVDWGTTNRRVYVIREGVVVHSERDADGVSSIPAGQFESEVDELRSRQGDLPVLMAGMVGSTIGWRVAPYVAAPAGIGSLARSMLCLDARTAIVPGVSMLADVRADVMRGEEVQLLGAVAGGLAPPDALLVQPGTHSKWASMRDGCIVDFTTSMTGELFGLVREGGVLAHELAGEAQLGMAFEAGLEEGCKRDLAASLFGIRSAALLGRRRSVDAASYASGLLIGAEVAARLERAEDRTVHVLADRPLAAFYMEAIGRAGREARLVDSEAAFVEGIWRIAQA